MSSGTACKTRPGDCSIRVRGLTNTCISLASVEDFGIQNIFLYTLLIWFFYFFFLLSSLFVYTFLFLCRAIIRTVYGNKFYSPALLPIYRGFV